MGERVKETDTQTFSGLGQANTREKQTTSSI